MLQNHERVFEICVYGIALWPTQIHTLPVKLSNHSDRETHSFKMNMKKEETYLQQACKRAKSAADYVPSPWQALKSSALWCRRTDVLEEWNIHRPPRRWNIQQWLLNSEPWLKKKAVFQRLHTPYQRSLVGEVMDNGWIMVATTAEN